MTVVVEQALAAQSVAPAAGVHVVAARPAPGGDAPKGVTKVIGETPPRTTPGGF